MAHPTPTVTSGRMVAALSGIGHLFNHLFEPIFYVVVLTLPQVYGISYESALTLIVAGKLLFGIAAPAAGWLADRWSATGMMGVYFLGMGGAAIWVGLADGPWEMSFALAALGLFGSIYHPVGIAWLMRSVHDRGKALGINGVFGSLGPAIGGVGAGLLVDHLGWRSAFLLPAGLVIITGVIHIILMARGAVVERKADVRADPPASAADTARAFTLLGLAMATGGLTYQATQAALPKLFDERLHGLLGDGTAGPGTAVMLVYGFSALMQVWCGHLADRYPLKTVYLLMVTAQAPVLALAGVLGGVWLLPVAMLMVTLNTGALPAENSLLTRYTPPRWRATMFGLKFVVSFGIAGLGVPLVSLLRGLSGDFLWLFCLLAAGMALTAAILIRLPGESPAPAAAPAE